VSRSREKLEWKRQQRSGKQGFTYPSIGSASKARADPELLMKAIRRKRGENGQGSAPWRFPNDMDRQRRAFPIREKTVNPRSIMESQADNGFCFQCVPIWYLLYHRKKEKCFEASDPAHKNETVKSFAFWLIASALFSSTAGLRALSCWRIGAGVSRVVGLPQLRSVTIRRTRATGDAE